ncbi:MAG: hypothetical protein K6E18_01515 [Lachnospiraceae bacterium]|nr:hypothetical protein [Lachnospiraceae bacterium]
MKKVIVIYDDRRMPGREIRTITGEKSFGETIVKRIPLSGRIREASMAIKNVRNFITLSEKEDFDKLKRELTNLEYSEKYAFVYLYSNFGIAEKSEFSALLQKASYVEEIYTALCDGEPAAVLLPDEKSLFENEERLGKRQFSENEIAQKAFADLSVQSRFLAYITGGFDARFFNALEGDAYTVTKKSSKKEKIKAEYEFYGLLPDAMKKWFVMPYDYREDQNGASYTMERIHTTDIAIRFVHGAVSTQELRDILETLFYFLKTRVKKTVGEEKAGLAAKAAYEDKVISRMKELKAHEAYARFDAMIAMGTRFSGIDAVVQEYLTQYREKRKKAYGMSGHSVAKDALAISHGDLCFSNILYSREAGLLKLIDPKGAQTEEELYMDPYYDIAKLSHSICGGYDYFNSGLYQVSLKQDLKWELSLDADLDPYREVFYELLEREGYDKDYVRICEAGLFLSMLPYHMDQPGKVFGFLLNAIRILEQTA